jgi:hypothetical protein
MNAICCCCISEVWIETAKLLRQNLNIRVSYFVGWKDDIDINEFTEKMRDCHLQYVEDAWRGNGFPKYVKNDTSIIDETILDKYGLDFWTALKMIDRLDPTGEKFSFSERSYWVTILIESWLQVIDNEEIELVISPSVPHRVFDFALYIAAKIRNVNFIMFQMTPFGDKSFIIDNVNSTPQYMKREMLNRSIEDSSLPKDIEARLAPLLASYDDAIPDYMIRQKKESQSLERVISKVNKIKKISRLFKNANTYRVIKKHTPGYEKISLLSYNVQLIEGEIFKSKLKNNYRSLVEKYSHRREKNDKYILVALHYQPEETSCPTGGFYAEQRQIVKLLSETLPENYKIYIKEHSSQFHPNMEGEAGRTSRYYHDLIGISNRVVLINDTDDTFTLIDNAIATATISGTIGWESVFRGCPAIVFGRAWYEDMSGVFKVKSRIELSESIDRILNGSCNIIQDDLMSYHKKLDHFLVAASHYKATADKKITNIQDSAKNLNFAIKQYFEMTEAYKQKTDYQANVKVNVT